ncbi:alpha/beta hydrolase [Planctomicrobium piriforme]|uniref:Alpha/beta hydrolase family protein n=1 Tax=Planctomicrobium piriforme TaxID=1576369 RepID=A0A1I3LPY4_9PLAN|nr:alpha/beta fold hydrolase [Planctomicrobium piriforme]SFI86575.1 Alpha/beta hydrolase family protein [Planctomicrobium piriforme]
MNPIVRYCGVVLACLACTPWAAAQTEGRHEVLRAADGYPIHVTYYPFKESKENAGATAQNAPVVILLHGAGENRLLWDKSSGPRDQDPFPILLQKRGYAVVSVDLRKHGESVVNNGDDPLHPNDYQAMVGGDLVAVKDFLFVEHQAQRLNVQKLGIVAVGLSAPIAASFAEYDWSREPYDDAPVAENRTPRGQDVKALILISPDGTAGRIKAATALKQLKAMTPNIALEVIVGAQDSADKRQAETVYQAYAPSARAAKENTKTEYLTPDLKDRGMALLRQGTVYAYAFKFLETNLKGLNIPWQDRRSLLER